MEAPGSKTTNALSDSPSWVNVSPPMDMPFNVVAVDPTDPRVVYAGSDVGLWRSVDAAATWVRMGPDTGLPHAPIYDIKINPTTNRTVVFTYGRGAFALEPEVVPGTAGDATTRPRGLKSCGKCFIVRNPGVDSAVNGSREPCSGERRRGG